MRGRVAGTFAGMVALLIAVPAHAETRRCRRDPIAQPGKQAPAPGELRQRGGVDSLRPALRTGAPGADRLRRLAVGGRAAPPAGTVVRFRSATAPAACACGSRS